MKKTIKVGKAKDRTRNPDAKRGLLDDYESDEVHSVHTDGNGVVIEMEEVGSPAQAPKSPAVTTATTPSKTSAPVKKSSEAPALVMEEVVDQFAIPEAVKTKMGIYAPRYVCMGEGDASGHQFVQFLYATENEAKQAATFLNQKLAINKKGQDNRVFACSLKPKVFPLFAQLKLFRVTVFPTTYFQVFGNEARPTMSRMNLENSLAKANGQQPPHSKTGASRAAQQRPNERGAGSSGTNVPLVKSTMPDDDEEDLYDLLTLAEDNQGSSGSGPDSDSEHRSNADVRVNMTPSSGAQVQSQRKDKEEINAAKAGEGLDAKAQETEKLLVTTPASDKKKGRSEVATPPRVNNAADDEQCVIF
ncbi:MAG: hypothetical protein K2X50_03545 [Gammaproteobacteria bacterium]|nr:hypothetical protein [Gammaproteobacteria bacterium]